MSFSKPASGYRAGPSHGPRSGPSHGPRAGSRHHGYKHREDYPRLYLKGDNTLVFTPESDVPFTGHTLHEVFLSSRKCGLSSCYWQIRNLKVVGPHFFSFTIPTDHFKELKKQMGRTVIPAFTFLQDGIMCHERKEMRLMPEEELYALYGNVPL